MAEGLPARHLLVWALVLGLVVASFAAAPFVSDAPWPRVAPALAEGLAASREDAKLDVVVILAAPPTQEKILELKRAAGGFAVESNKEHPWDTEGRPWTIIPGFQAALTSRQVAALASRADVRYLEGVPRSELMMDTARIESGVAKARADFGVDGDRDGYPWRYTKDDVVICIVDTGVDARHVDLDGGKVIGWKDFIHGLPLPYDDLTHGTHVAGIAAGEGDGNASFVGVAPGAALAVAKAFGLPGTTPHDIDGMNWCVENKAALGISMMSLSFGTRGCNEPLLAHTMAVNNATAAGIVVVAAAGNGGPGTCTVTSPGSVAAALTVGSMSDPRNACGSDLAFGWYLWHKSSRGPTQDGRVKPDILAPGVCITAPLADSVASYISMTGTSMATPFVAGVVALMLDANPALTPAEVKSILHGTAQDWGLDDQAAEPQSVDYGAGRLQAHGAVEAACACGDLSGPDNPADFHRAGSLGAGAQDTYELVVVDPGWALSATLIVPGAGPAKNFDLAVYRPDGALLASSNGTSRQENVSASIRTGGPGTYILLVYSVTGSGGYGLDVSAGATSLTLRPAK